MDITITDVPFVSAAALDSTLCEGDTTVLFIDSLSGGLLVEQFTMTFGSAFSYMTTNTNLPGNYYVVVNGTYSGNGPCENRDGAFWFYQGCNNVTPIEAYPWRWNGQNPSTQSITPYVYNPNHEYYFFFEGGGPQTYSFTENNPNWYSDNSGSLTFDVYYLGDIVWSTGSIEASDTVTPPAGSSNYTVTLDYGNGCVVTDDVTINVEPLVTPVFDQLGPYCENNLSVVNLPSVSLGGISGSWSPSTIDMTIAGTATYTFTSDVTQCALNTTMDVVIEPSPAVGITNNTGDTALTCTLLEISLTATGGENYLWDNALGTESDVIIDGPGIYTVIGYSPIGCESSAQIEITQDNEVDIFAALSVNEICTGESAVINVTSSNATNFEWVVTQNEVTGASDGSGANGPTGLDIVQSLSVTGSGPGTVDYTITPILGICSGVPQTITITVNPLIEPVFLQLGPYCVNDFITDNLNTISENGISGLWDPSIINVDLAGTTIYTYTPEEGECAAPTTMEIIVNDLPEVNFSGDILEGCAPLEVTFNSSGPGDCLWTVSNGEVLGGSTATTTFINPGCYDITLTVEENGCSNSSTLIDYVCIENDPIAEFSVFPQSFSDVNQIIDFTNNSQGASSYFWDFGDSNTSIDESPNHLYEETEEGIYVTLTAISDFGCIDSVSIVIPFDEQEIFYVPNTFTPDGDNFNQVFNPVFYSGFDPFNFEMLIFNRWGQVIFETHNTEIGWDGSYSDQTGIVSDGIYTWKITYKNPKTDERKILIGHVLVLR
jgi:gliding motility-associated-like protein